MFRSGPLKGGLQEKMYFLFGCVRCASGKYDLIDRECDFQRKVSKNKFVYDVFVESPKKNKNEDRIQQKLENGSPGEQK